MHAAVAETASTAPSAATAAVPVPVSVCSLDTLVGLLSPPCVYASKAGWCWLLPRRVGLLVPPSAEQRPKQLTQHNDTRQDKYYW